MAYTVLARKYRSQTFDDIVGQEPIAQTLKNAIKTGRVAHAFLFSGTRGVGKTTMARVLAKALNCLSSDGPTTEPCCKCDSCLAVNAGEDIDVIEIDGATNNGVDQVRELRQNAIYRPARSRFKIYIIDEVHMLSTPAFNALLKILEEPPSHVKFIFATTEPNKVIATIQSRCQRFDFHNINPAKIAEQLKMILGQENIRYEEDLVLPVAKMANGSMRDALSLLDRLISTGAEPLTAKLLEEFIGCPESEKIHNLVSAMGNSDGAAALTATDDLINAGLTEAQIVDALIDYIRDLMVIKSAGAASELVILSAEQRKMATALAEKFDVAGLVYNITTLEKLRWTIKNSDTARALLEAAMLRFALSEHFLNVDDLLSRANDDGDGGVKKKLTAVSAVAKVEKEPAADVKQEDAGPLSLGDLESIKSSWQKVLEVIGSRLGNGTRTLFGEAEPIRFENGVLTASFPAAGKTHKMMCESNGRLEQIEAVLSSQFGKAVRLKLEIASALEAAEIETAAEPKEAKDSGQIRTEIINDPAVKAVLRGLNATVTNIEEEQ